MIHLTDKNGAEFHINSIEDLTDLSKDIHSVIGHVADHQMSSTIPSIECQVVDHLGEIVDRYKLADSIKKDASNRPSAIDVTFEATHSGKNLNFAQYNSEDLEAGAHTWKSPFPKPLIKNHDVEVEPIGRVLDYSFGPSEFIDDKDTINVTFRVTDADAIDKFLDGRYRTMSIGAKCGRIKCNVCGKSIYKDNEFKFCGHMRGQKYGTETAYWTMSDFTYSEGSVVNTPADVWAQAKRIEIVKNEEDGAKPMPKDNELQTEEPVVSDADFLDNILEDSEPHEPTEAPVVEDNKKPAEEPKDEEDATKADLQEAIDALTAEVHTLTDENEALKQEVADLKEQLELLDAQLAEREKELGDAATSARKQNVRLAQMNKQLMAERITDHQVMSGAINLEDKEVKTSELLAKRASELMKMMDFDFEGKTQSTRSLAKPVTNPGIVSSDSETASEEPKATMKPRRSYRELEDSLVTLLSR